MECSERGGLGRKIWVWELNNWFNENSYWRIPVEGRVGAKDGVGVGRWRVLHVGRVVLLQSLGRRI